MYFPRSCGILLHPTSLPGMVAIGDLGPEAYAFVDFLAAAGQSFWQTLPPGPPDSGGSPYACYSAFAGNPLMVSPDELIKIGLLDISTIVKPDAAISVPVDFEQARNLKDRLLRNAFGRFQQAGDPDLRADFETFKHENAEWLNDYGLFRALKDVHGGAAWHVWDEELRCRKASALEQAATRLQDEIELHKFSQFLFFRQSSSLKAYANERGIKLIGDLPIFVAHDSVDVWTHQQLFKLDQAGFPRVVAGVPPDYFSATGQFWGNPLYNWEAMEAEGFSWWIARIRQALTTADALRIDHFRGFSACWEIPAGDTTAERGVWVDAPGQKLFAAIHAAIENLPIIAEDLGVITPDVEKLRDDFGFPGMRVLQFAFGGDPDNRDLPHNYNRNSVVYTGTHDNDTTVGWFRNSGGSDSTRLPEAITREREFCLKYLNSDGKEIHWDFIRAALASPANLAIIPLQDVMGLGTEARMNRPNTTEGNWTWRYQKEDLRSELAEKLRELTEIYGRLRVANVAGT